ncbi:MAG: hypothetical protein HYV26_02340, partial [Candidatus Hydrogenedentes bacterium]|nr:hypothetical protein [Candidatus Hydrogenedentota bacterium]
MKRAATVVKGALAAPALAWWCAGLGVLLAAPSLLGGIQMDDHYLRMVVKGAPGLPDLGISRLDVFTFAGNDAAKNAVRIDAGLVPWWTSANARIRFFRPLSALTHYLDFRMLDGQWWLMHLQSLLWYGALCGAAAAAYRRVIPSVWVAGLAAVFFAADDAHGLPVGWLANRNALLTGIAGVLTLVSHDYWRRGDCRRDVPVAYFRFLGPAMMALGLLCGEAAIGAAGYVAAYALFLDPGTKRERFLSLLPYGLVAGVYLFFYALAGFGIQHSGIYAAPSEQPATFALHVVEHLPVLLHAQLGLVSANPYVLMPPRVQQVQVLLGAAVIAASFA